MEKRLARRPSILWCLFMNCSIGIGNANNMHLLCIRAMMFGCADAQLSVLIGTRCSRDGSEQSQVCALGVLIVGSAHLNQCEYFFI